MATALSRMFRSVFGPRRAEWCASAGDAVLRLDADGVILAVTPAIEAMFAKPGGETGHIGQECDLLGRSILDFVAPEDRAGVKSGLTQVRAAALNAPAARVECRLLGGDIAGAGFAELAMVLAGDEISVLIRPCGPELSALREARAQQENQAETQDNSGGSLNADVLADLGHELKTPLNAIIGFAETMRQETFGPLGDDKYREYAELIHASGGHLDDLIVSILDRARLDAGQYPFAPALSAPGALAKHSADMVRSSVEQAGLKFAVEIADDLPEAMLDATIVKQILTNLLSNAVKFTSDGVIALTLREHDGMLDFTVSDTGVGMSQIALARLGERFTDLHKNGVRGTPGTGLGLSLAFSLARLHGGALALSSAPGEGTVARLTVPVRKSMSDFTDADMGSIVPVGDVHSQLDRVAQFRRERQTSGRSAA